MKKLSMFVAMLAFTGLSQSMYAQNEVAILHQNGNSYYFEGAGSLTSALDSAQNGDTIYLSAGNFTAPSGINKGVMILGSGHFPDVTSQKRTTLTSGLTISQGADSLYIEGLYIDGNVSFENDASINEVKIKRCRTNNINFNSISVLTSKNNCCVEECYVFGCIAQGYNPGISSQAEANNLQIIRNVIHGMSNWYGSGLLRRLKNAVIYRNILLCNVSSCFLDVKNSQINGNIIINQINTLHYDCTNNQFENNIFTDTTVNFSSNISNNNYMGISQDSIFINQTGTTIDYSHNYHLQYPLRYTFSTDNTEIGLFGGTTPFKESGFPFNPQVIRKNIGIEVLPNGSLPIDIRVESQDR